MGRVLLGFGVVLNLAACATTKDPVPPLPDPPRSEETPSPEAMPARTEMDAGGSLDANATIDASVANGASKNLGDAGPGPGVAVAGKCVPRPGDPDPALPGCTKDAECTGLNARCRAATYRNECVVAECVNDVDCGRTGSYECECAATISMGHGRMAPYRPACRARSCTPGRPRECDGEACGAGDRCHGPRDTCRKDSDCKEPTRSVCVMRDGVRFACASRVMLPG